MVIEITTFYCTCDRCGHDWVSKGGDLPKRCAKCNAKGWNANHATLPADEPTASVSDLQYTPDLPIA